MTSQPELILLPSLAAHRDPTGRLSLTKKYLDGVAEFEKHWPGRVTSLVTIDPKPNSEMDLIEVDFETSPPYLEHRPPDDSPELRHRLARSAAVLAHLAPQESRTAELCRALNVPIIFTSEYTPTTEAQIIDADTSNAMLRMRRKLWIARAEKTRRHMLRSFASGLQCSGTPTYDLYRSLVPDVHLFFDNRVRRADVISEADLAAKASYVMQGKPLRLVFGGRFVAMKGILDLPKVAAALQEMNVPFSLDIVGSGPLEQPLREAVAGLGNDAVRVHPPMDFKTGWVPFMRERVDLFLCCHPQGDPSSTYPETMSCGTPIVGYDNEAWAGVRRTSNAGWSVPLGDSAALARKVAALHEAREQIAEHAQRSRAFAMAHCFEETEVARVAHLRRIALSNG